jgi:hypothetical protein
MHGMMPVIPAMRGVGKNHPKKDEIGGLVESICRTHARQYRQILNITHVR